MLSEERIALLKYKANGGSDEAVRILMEHGLWEEKKEIEEISSADEDNNSNEDTHMQKVLLQNTYKDPKKSYRRDVTIKQNLYLILKERKIKLSTLINKLLLAYCVHKGFIVGKTKDKQIKEEKLSQNEG